MDWLGLTHTAAAAGALLFGVVVFRHRKGTTKHKMLGYAYVVSMLLLNVTAFAIYDLFGGWGAFHWAALVSSVTLAMGFIPVLLRKPARTWIEWHYMGMCWSYVGLAAAAGAEVLTRLPALVPGLASVVSPHFFWNMVGLSTFIVCGTGYYLINRRRLGYGLVRAMLSRP